MKYYVENIDKVINSIENKSSKALKKVWTYLEWKIRKQMEKDSYDTGHLAESINTKQINNEKVVVGTNVEYALVREYGRRPWKFPPLDALVGRTARKGIINGNKTARFEDLHYEDKGKVFIIARAIAVKGIQGKHTFENTINAEKDKFSDLFIKYYNQW